MPLSAISRRAGAASSFASITFRELLAHRRRALTAARRGREGAEAMVARIDAELEARRLAKFDRHPAPEV
ncbi:MAG: hypothetical protein AAGF49_03865 [Pseudomonadota bacterium]